MEIGNRIKQRRVELDMTADDLAEKIGKSRATVYRYENGDIENMPTTVLEPIAKALKTTPAYLMGWEDRDIVESYDNTVSLSDREHTHILTYRDLSDQGKDRVDEYTERTRDLEKQDEDSKIVESFQNRFVARNGNKNLTPDQMKAIMDILDGGSKDV